MFDINNDIVFMFNDFGIEAILNNQTNSKVIVIFYNNYGSTSGFELAVGGNKPFIYIKEKDFINNNITIDDQLIIKNIVYQIDEIQDNDYIYQLTLKKV